MDKNYLFISLLFVPLVRFLIYFRYWWFFKSVINKRCIYIDGAFKDSPEEDKKQSERASIWLMSNITEIKRLVKRAGLSEPVISFMEAKGYGFVGQESLNVFDNILFLNVNVQNNVSHVLHVAKGHYFNQVKNSINPIYWVEVLFFLPKEMVNASGFVANTKLSEVLVNIGQIVYWIAVILVIIKNPNLIGDVLKAKS
jgi:hypothetical protein